MEQILLGTNKTSTAVANQHVRDSGKTQHQQAVTSSALAIQPSSKLEQIEQILLYSNAETPQPCCPHNTNKKSTGIYNSSGIINLVTMNAAATLNSEGCCHKLIKNFVFFDGGGGGGGGGTEPKIYSLQRSISEKLRNSFKNKSHNVNMSNLGHLPKVATSNEQPIRAPRKWHSERCRTNNLLANPTHSITLSNMKPPPPPVGHKFSTQIPLSSHYKAILAQYTLKPKQETQLSLKSRPATFKRNTKLNKEYSRIPIKSQSKKPAPIELINQVL